MASGNLNLLCNAEYYYYDEKSITINYEEQKLYPVLNISMLKKNQINYSYIVHKHNIIFCCIDKTLLTR